MTHLIKTPSQRGTVFMVISLFFFASSVLLLRGLALRLEGSIGWHGILFRGWVGLVILLTFFGGSRGLVLRHCFTHGKVAARGIVGAIATLLFYISIVELGASRAIVINLSYPLFGAILAAVWLRESVTLRAGFWLLAGFGGLVIFFSSGVQSQAALGNSADAHFAGLGTYDLVAIAGAVTSGIAVVLIRGLSKDHHPSTIYSSQCLYGVLITVPVVGLQIFTLPPFAWGILILSGCLVACGQLAITYGFRDLSVAKGSSIQMVLPLMTTAGAFFIYQETLSPTELLGGLLTLIATWQVLRLPAQKPAETAPTAIKSEPNFPLPNNK